MEPEAILMAVLLSFGTKVLKKSFWFIVFLAGISLQEFDETNEALLALIERIRIRFDTKWYHEPFYW